ncbi:aminotransferase class III-fold pyridoxal phosphate-dependent enzyme [Streptomyces phyllanthi]|uniref:Aminotransferase class III-fold pyridoxal phosphate-dependent enzyme n=1 Tax=Streptomyces phyllanthi TaxID=1803180 RepID=A0A5N8VV11_9ACTN|nr:aminotransferase class III-fold pyridoxal phosphate-dependent enzyme [Streptomyces phyllanthi]MPY38612.1 aminotransferase class III-fold pyridoxal phosphate-dependent enzyme [Streptomyces phyllanthi]
MTGLATRPVVYSFTDHRVHRQEPPLIIAEGDGIRVRDVGGREYIDALSGLWHANLGFSEPDLIAAATAAYAELPAFACALGRTSAETVLLAEELLQAAGGKFRSVYFGASGSEAVESVLKFLWLAGNTGGAPARKLIVTRDSGFHGTTLGAATLAGIPRQHDGFDLPLPFTVRVPRVHFYRDHLDGESEDEYVARIVRTTRERILAAGPENVAAMVAEPVMAAGGVLVPPDGYWPAMARLLAELDVPLVSDEVVCGFGRLGHLFGYQRFGLEPAAVTVAKGITAGYAPLGAVLLGADLTAAIAAAADTHGVLGHGSTFGGHPVAAAVARANLRIIRERKIYERVAELETLLETSLEELLNLPVVGEVRCVGGLAAVELMADGVARRPFDPERGIGRRVAAEARARGLIVRDLGDVIALCPPLITGATEVMEIVSKLRAAIVAAVTEEAR